MTIRMENLKKYYGRFRGVESVNLSLNHGEILGFIGPNGAGKSTVIRVLVGLIRKTSGFVEVLDNPPSEITNRDVGYMPSELFFYQELTVLEQLRYLAHIRKTDMIRIEQLAKRLDLDLSRKIKELSTGNRKKLGIIAALMDSPKVLILDEPTSGLDPLMQKEFFTLLQEEKKKGASILLSSHILSDIEKVCDRICLIREGVTLFTETLENLKSEKYKRIFVTPAFTDIKLTGLVLVGQENNQAIYQYKGDINPLLEILSYHRLNDVKIVDLDLEEIFINYYQKEEAND